MDQLQLQEILLIETKRVPDLEFTLEYQSLLNFLIKEKYRYLPDHKDNLRYALIFRIVKDNATLGYVWLYELEEAENKFVTHMCVAEKHKGRVFTRHTVNKFYLMSHYLGAVELQTDTIDDELVKLYKRIGWSEQNDQTLFIKLPFEWRKKWEQ